MQRLICTALAALLLSATTSAQDGLRSASLPDRPPTQIIPPTRIDQFVAGPRTYTPRLPTDRRDRFPRHRSGRRHDRDRFDHNSGFGTAYGAYGYGSAPVLGGGEAAQAEEMLPNGYLHFQMQPGNAEVHVDGLYMGTVDDFRRLIPGRSLEAGEHRVELRATGYQPTSFEVLIEPNATVTYRTDLSPAQPERPRIVALAEPKTFYVIPGCYAGDRPPQTARLRSGCDASKLRKIPPVVGVIARAQR